MACDVTQLFTKFERNQSIRGAVIAISVLDLRTLNAMKRIPLGFEIFFTKPDLRQLIHP